MADTSLNITISEYQYRALLAENESLKAANARLEVELKYHTFELAKLKRMIFGAKSERFISSQDPNQLSIDVQIETQPAPEIKKEEISYTRKKQQKPEIKGHAREALPSHLRREEIIIEPEEDVTGAKKIGENITEILEYKQGELYVKKYIRPKYALAEESGIVTGTLPTLPIPKGNAGPGLISHIITSKYVDHLPFYRQKEQFKRIGYELAESTLNDWFRHGCSSLEYVYNGMKKELQSVDYLQADETPIPVQTKDKQGATHKGYLWVYYSPPKKMVIFDYRKTRGSEGPREFLKDFKGTLQCDGYSGYDMFDKQPCITLLACWAHARRKFDEAKDNDKVRAEYMLSEIQKLYDIEANARELGMTWDERKELRHQKSKPILDNIEIWLKKEILAVLPKSAIGKAICYTMGLWPRLKRYIDDGKCEIDNNLIENKIRPVAIGRKNYLFAGSHDAAQRAAIVYSLLGTCKMHGVDTEKYLTDVFSLIPDCKQSQFENLFPQNWKPLNSE